MTVGERIFQSIISMMFLGLPLLSLTTRTAIFDGKAKRQHVFPEYFDNVCTLCNYKWKWVVGTPKPQVAPQPELVAKREAYEKRRKWETTKNGTAYSGTGANRNIVGDRTNAGFVTFQFRGFYAWGEIGQTVGNHGTIFSEGTFLGKAVGQVSEDGTVYSISGGLKRAVGEVDKNGIVYIGTGSLRKAVGEVEPADIYFGGAALILCLIPMIEKQRQAEYANEQFEIARAHQAAEDALRRAGWR